MYKKLHILFLCGWYPSRVFPTNGDFIKRHAEAVSLQHNVSVLHIITDKNCTDKIEIVSKEINHISTHIAYVKPVKNPIVKVTLFYKAFKKLVQVIDNFDVVHLNKTYPFGMFTLLLKQPYIISEHWTDYEKPMCNKISSLEKFTSKLICKNATYICPVSNHLKKSMIAFGLKGNYTIVPNVVDTDLFFPVEKKDTQQFTLLHISNMVDAQKNVSGILKTLAKLQEKTTDFKLILIGENSKKHQQLAKKLNILSKISFIEHVKHKQIPNFLQQADVYISFSNYETWGIVMVESLACGTPVISTKTGILYELNLTKFSTFVNNNNEDELLQAILKFKTKNSINKNEMYQYVLDNFNPKHICNTFSKLYHKSLK